MNVFNDWEMSEKDRVELVDVMRTKLKNIATDYAAETINYEQATAIYSTIHQMYLDELYEDEITAYSEIQTINYSKQMFIAGTEAMEMGDYLYAIECFNQVSELDINYETALANADEALQTYVDNVITNARELARQNDYNSAYNSLTVAKK